MKGSLAFLGLAATALAVPKGGAVTAQIKPDSGAPQGCSGDFTGKFQVTVAKVAGGPAKRDLTKRACGNSKDLELTLSGGVLKDAQQRTGYIASNYQFQFDGPPQAGAIYTAGFSKCSNGSLALGGSTTFYQCRSGGFYNLYDRSWAAQCEPIEILAMDCAGAAPPAAQSGDGQVVGTSMITTTIVSAIGDGQPQVITTAMPVPICQIGDGQVQGHTTRCDQITQIGDGQIQAPTGAPVAQIPDGQVQGPSSIPVMTGAPVGQIGDGQVQATTAAPAAPTGKPVSQIGDGQVQASSATPVSQIGDGQVQAPTNAPVTGAASGSLPQSIAALVAVMGVVLYL